MCKWYEKAVFYHIYPLGLTGTLKKNKEENQPSQFPCLEKWIPHIKTLGCNALYIGPLFESGSHGYDTIDYKKTDCRLGSNEELKEFINQCHTNGIRVVLDGVFNHTGRDFPAFKEILSHGPSSKFCSWYKNLTFHNPDSPSDLFTCEYWQGHRELPCLNLINPEVKNHLLDAVKFWIEFFDIDGIRLDCANILDFQFMEDLKNTCSFFKPDFWLMGEVIHGDYNRWLEPGPLHSVTNYQLHKSLYSSHNDHNYFEVAHNVKRLEQTGSSLYTFVDNHDENRIYSKLLYKEHLYPVYQLLFTLPGIPSIYYGGEWGISGMRDPYGDDDLRPALNLDEYSLLHTDFTDFLTDLIHIHIENPEFHTGRYQELFLTNRQYAFVRYGTNSAIISAVNNDDSDSIITLPLPIHSEQAINLFTHEPVPVEDNHITIHLPPNRGTIVKLMEG